MATFYAICRRASAAGELSSLEATIELLADPPAVERVRQAEADVAAGDLTSAAEMAELMRRRLERSASSDE
jgi:hypothetical protein